MKSEKKSSKKIDKKGREEVWEWEETPEVKTPKTILGGLGIRLAGVTEVDGIRFLNWEQA